MTRKFDKQKLTGIVLFGLAVLGGIVFIFAALHRPKAQREDYQQIAFSTYDTVFLSMYPIDTYDAEDFLTYRGMTVLKTSYCIPGFTVMKQYMKHIAASQNTVSTVYLGIRPDKISRENLKSLCALYPAIYFEIILSYPSADYWSRLSAANYEKVLTAYLDLLAAASDIPNAHFYCIGSQEWLLANPNNYRDEWTVAETVAQTIMLRCDILQEYLVTAETSPYFSQKLQEVTQKIRTAPSDFRDLSDHRIIFFGDSVIGNYTDSTSIPEVVAGLTGADVYNCGYGGNSAALGPDQIIAFAGIAESFANRDLSKLPLDIQAYQGISAYLSSPLQNDNLCIVVNYGLNDYFKGYPMDSETNPQDVTTFCGAIRTAVGAIRAAHPNAQIILCTPSCCAFYEFGTEPHGEEGYVLEDYAETILSLSEELNTSVLDVYHAFPISRDNWTEYLIPDQIHPNEAYRYLIGTELSRLIR